MMLQGLTLGASTGTSLTDDNEGPLDLTVKKAAQATTVIAPTERPTEAEFCGN